MALRIELTWAEPAEFKELVVKWNFDHPKAEQAVEEGKIVRIKGWVVTKGNIPITLVLNNNKIMNEYTLNQHRPDVIKKVLLEEPENHSQHQCGFAYDVEVDGDTVALGFRVNEKNYWVGNLKLEKIRKIHSSRRGNLFLDNDANHYIEQYRGVYPIPDSEVKLWRDFICGLGDLEREYAIRTALLISPGKEFVYSEDFPYDRGVRTPVDEVLEFCDSQQRVIYPLDELRQDQDITYSAVDTHWTDYGAMVAARAVGRIFGDDFPITLPQFQLVMRDGDLGSKVANPPIMPFFEADFLETSGKLIFSNGVNNHGRMNLFENPQSKSASRLLLYGDFFSLNLAPWLSLYYREVLYIDTAGSIDTDIVAQFVPDLLVVQTNTRFLIKSPLIGLQLNQVITSTLEKLGQNELASLRAKVSSQNDCHWKSWTLQLIDAVRSTAA